MRLSTSRSETKPSISTLNKSLMIVKPALFLILVSLLAVFCRAQANVKNGEQRNAFSKPNFQVKSSPAYAEIILRKTERASQLEELLLDYTEEFPKIKEIRYELSLIEAGLNKILGVPVSDVGKLTLALGKLLVRKTELETDLWSLRQEYTDDRPEVKRAKRKVEIFDKAVRDILP